MKTSIYIRIFLTHLLVILISVGLIITLSLRSIQKHQTDMQSDSLRRIARSLEIPFTREFAAGGVTALDSLAKHIGGVIGTRITVIDLEGVVRADSWHDPDAMESHRTRPEIMRAIRGETGRAERFSTTAGQDFLYVAIPIKTDGTVAGVLRVSLPVSHISRSVEGLRSDIILLTSVVVLLALVAALVSSRNISKPILALSRASKRMAGGDFEARVLLKGGGELRELADSFNNMAGRLQGLFRELSGTGEELASIVGAIRDGLVVLDGDGRIILSNRSFMEIAGDEGVEGKHFWEIIRNTEFGDLVKSISEHKANRVSEVTLGEKIFLCSGGYLASRNGVVVILHDITDLRRVEKIKKDFVINLSHELRTPLTAVKGFLETLEDEVTDEGRRYLAIIIRHSDRLAHIVDDLLLLSNLEDRQTRLELERVDLKDLAESVLHMFEQPAGEKGLSLKVLNGGDGPIIEGDRFKLEQVFMNLFANAVKYTERGGVTVRLGRQDPYATVTVEDTGIGISEEDLPRIFERFYVADKSRSRSVGGTGLGLSIVKHIVLLHNGVIDVESSPGKGTIVTVRLPVSPS
jgi:two-component system phosphate regulon sensor histidine kinase PhoR